MTTIHEEFRDNVENLFVKPFDPVGRMVHASLGICTEAGEIGTTVKAHWIYGRPVDYGNLIEEIGDLLFYIEALCQTIGVEMNDCMAANVAKLRKRYPNGYSDQAANERADKCEDDCC